MTRITLPYKVGDILKYDIVYAYSRRTKRISYGLVKMVTDQTLMILDLTTNTERSISIKTFESRRGSRIQPTELPPKEQQTYNKFSSTLEIERCDMTGAQIKPKDINLTDVMTLEPGQCIQTQSGYYMGLDSKDMILDLSNFSLLPKIAIEAKVGVLRKISITVD